MKQAISLKELAALDATTLIGDPAPAEALEAPVTAILYVEDATGLLHPAIAMHCAGKPSNVLEWFTASKLELGDLGGRPTHLTLMSRALLSLQLYATAHYDMLDVADTIMPWSQLVLFNVDGTWQATPHVRYAIRWTHAYDEHNHYVRTGLTLEVLP